MDEDSWLLIEKLYQKILKILNIRQHRNMKGNSQCLMKRMNTNSWRSSFSIVENWIHSFMLHTMVITLIGNSLMTGVNSTIWVWKTRSVFLLDWKNFMDDLQLIWIAFIGSKETLIFHKDLNHWRKLQKQNLDTSQLKLTQKLWSNMQENDQENLQVIQCQMH